MATIRSFRAIRPTRDKVNLVASRSYLSYSEETLNEKLDNNPFTFLHIILSLLLHVTCYVHVTCCCHVVVHARARVVPPPARAGTPLSPRPQWRVVAHRAPLNTQDGSAIVAEWRMVGDLVQPAC